MGIHQSIETMEGLRKKYNFMKNLTIVIMVGFMAGMFLMHNGAEFSVFFLMVGMVIAIGIISYKGQEYKKEFKGIYKEMFAREALNELLDNVEYTWHRGFSELEVSTFDIVRMGNRYSSEDYLKASYKGVEFEQADVTIKYRTSGKNKRTIVYFEGKMLKFPVPPKKALMLQVFTDNFPYRAETGYKMSKIDMEDVEFNRIYDVKSYDEHEAFYVLTPQFMERLKSIAGRYSSVGFHFKKGVLYVAMNTSRDSFDADFNNPVIYPKEMAKMQSDIQDIIDIIEALGFDKE